MLLVHHLGDADIAVLQGGYIKPSFFISLDM